MMVSAVFLANSPVLGVAPQVSVSHGIDFVTVGAPGNAPALDPHAFFGIPIGAVDHQYRIARTELTVRQWMEFVQAYAPFLDPSMANSSTFLGRGIWKIYGNYEYRAVDPDEPTDMTWEYAARYANWLHNGKVNEAWAFESGAYDTSLFGKDANGLATHPLTHEPGARFWIPSLDEWIKAVHYDPDRYGTNEPGYWTYPYASEQPPVWGIPEEGGQTNGGRGPDGLTAVDWLPVGSYPNAMTPWGLFDASGGVQEWTETVYAGIHSDQNVKRGTRTIEGSQRGGFLLEYDDRIDWSGLGGVQVPLAGLRLAAETIPAPSASLAMVVTLIGAFQRRLR